MLTIFDELQWLDIVEDIAHQQVLLADKIGGKYKIMTMLLKQDWKLVGMIRETISNLISRLQPFVTAVNKSPKNYNWENMLSAISGY